MEHKKYVAEFLKYVFLNVLGMAALSCYILADTFFVAERLGAEGLAALNLAIPVYNFIHGSGLMLGMGGAIRYAILSSRKRKEEVRGIFSSAVYLALVFSVLFWLAGYFFSGQLAELLGAEEIILDMTKTYLRYLLMFAPLFIMNDLLICFVRNDGNPRLSMAAMVLGSLANIVLDYVFMLPLNMGILGAVLATGTAPVCSMAILSRHFIKKKNGFHFIRTRLSAKAAGSIFTTGLPSLITELSAGLVMILFNMVILGMEGNTGVAAYGVIANLYLVAAAIFTGVAQGVQPLISREYGQKHEQGMKRILHYALLTAVLLTAGIYTAVFLDADGIVRIFNSEGNAGLQVLAVQGMKLYFTGLLFVGTNTILSMFFAATERVVFAHLISILRGVVLIIPITVFLAEAAGMTGVWMAFPVTEGLVAVLSIFLFFYTNKNGGNRRP